MGPVTHFNGVYGSGVLCRTLGKRRRRTMPAQHRTQPEALTSTTSSTWPCGVWPRSARTSWSSRESPRSVAALAGREECAEGKEAGGHSLLRGWNPSGMETGADMFCDWILKHFEVMGWIWGFVFSPTGSPWCSCGCNNDIAPKWGRCYIHGLMHFLFICSYSFDCSASISSISCHLFLIVCWSKWVYHRPFSSAVTFMLRIYIFLN